MTAPIAVTINGVSITNHEQDTFEAESIMGQTIGTARLRIYDPLASLSIAEMQDVIITRPDTGDRIFGGFSSIVTMTTKGSARWWDVRCQDYGVLLDTTLVLASYKVGMSDADIITDIFANRCLDASGNLVASEISAMNFSLGGYVHQSVTSLGSLVFAYNTLREVLSALGSLSNSDFYVDQYKNLHYYVTEDTASHFSLDSDVTY